MEKVIGKHYAKEVNYVPGDHCFTVSVGVCPVLEAKDGEPKLGASVVRVKGLTTEEGVAEINRIAELVAVKLDHGNYRGPKTISTDSFHVGNL